MAGSALNPVLAAIYTLLSSDAILLELLGAGGGVFNAPPDGQAASAYVLLNSTVEQPNDTLESGNAGLGNDCLISTDAVSPDRKDADGSFKAQALNSRIVELLHGADLNVEGFATVTCEWENSTPLTDRIDGGRPLRRVVSDFRVLVEAE